MSEAENTSLPPIVDQVDILARTLYGEARGEGRAGMEAVASVIMNRAQNPRWWGKDVIGVCKAPWQFSCWNEDDVNRPKLLAVTNADNEFRACLEVANLAISGNLKDPTSNSDSYYDTSIQPPNWALGQPLIYSLGDLRFYRLELKEPE